MRNLSELKSLSDFYELDAPQPIYMNKPEACPYEKQMVLRIAMSRRFGKRLKNSGGKAYITKDNKVMRMVYTH